MADSAILIWVLINTIIDSREIIFILVASGLVMNWCHTQMMFRAPRHHPSDNNPSPESSTA